MEELTELLRSVNKELMTVAESVMRHHGVVRRDLLVVKLAGECPGITVSQIARKTGMAKSHISRTVDGLTQAGVLEKHPDPSDRRLIRVYVTGQAEAHFKEAQELIKERLADALGDLPPDQMESIVDGLRVLRSALKGERRDKA